VTGKNAKECYLRYTKLRAELLAEGGQAAR